MSIQLFAYSTLEVISMAGSGFFKGEKKKQKKDKDKRSSGIITSSAPVFTLPKVISKKKNEQ